MKAINIVLVIAVILFFFITNFQLLIGKASASQLSSLQKFYVKKIHIKNNLVIPQQTLSEMLAPYENREITIRELEDLRLQLSTYYMEQGYVNSGVLIPEQDVSDGNIEFIVIAGKITETSISGNTWLASGYIAKRLQLATQDENGPFNINVLRERLKLLKQDPKINNINASIAPGLLAGEASLKVEIEEARPYTAALNWNNHVSPSVGGFQTELSLLHYNLSGWGDQAKLNYSLTKGSDSYSAEYIMILSRYDTSLSFSFDRSDSTVITPPFDQIDIESSTDTLKLSLKHPFIKSLEQEFTAGLALEKKKTKTTLLDIPFSFTAHEDDHETKITTFSCSQEWIKKSLNYVFAANSELRFGRSWFDATVHEGEYADSIYTAWQGQAQLFKRFWEKDSLLIKAGFQLADDSLLSAEKFAIGGASSVRGYRENQITADNGLNLSIELRHPLGHLALPTPNKKESDGLVEVCPFLDFGRGWNKKSANSDPDSLSGIGLGLRWTVNSNIKAGIYYGHRLTDIDEPANYDLQDDGIHFSFDVRLF